MLEMLIQHVDIWKQKKNETQIFECIAMSEIHELQDNPQAKMYVWKAVQNSNRVWHIASTINILFLVLNYGFNPFIRLDKNHVIIRNRVKS